MDDHPEHNSEKKPENNIDHNGQQAKEPKPADSPPQSSPPTSPQPPPSVDDQKPTPPPQQSPSVPPSQPTPQPSVPPPTPTPAPQSSEVKLQESDMDRRTFIKWLALGWVAFAAIVGGYATMILRFLFPNVLFEPKQSFKAGFPDEYTIGEVSLRWKSQFGVWIVRNDESIYALSTTCTHLGCTPNWLSNENKFKCPCHGSGFYKTGINFEGPAPRPLERFRIVLADDGQILIDKTKKFQQEKGEWSDPDSFLVV